MKGKFIYKYDINAILIPNKGDNMVQAIININETTNRALNIIKAKYGLKDKSEAIDMMAEQYIESVLEPELRPEFIREALMAEHQPSIKVGTVANLRRRYEK